MNENKFDHLLEDDFEACNVDKKVFLEKEGTLFAKFFEDIQEMEEQKNILSLFAEFLENNFEEREISFMCSKGLLTLLQLEAQD